MRHPLVLVPIKSNVEHPTPVLQVAYVNTDPWWIRQIIVVFDLIS